MSLEDMRNKLLDMGVTEKEIELLEYIAGETQKTYEDILYVRFGYRTFDQIEN